MSNGPREIGQRILFTGQTGLNKSEYLKEVIKYCKEKYDKTPILFNVGDMMYKEIRDMGGSIEEGKILNLPIIRLKSIRRSVLKEIMHYCNINLDKDVIINSHACFRWRNGLFFAFDYDLLNELNITKYITLIDDVDAIYFRIKNNLNIEEDYSLNELLTWREEEIIITEAVAMANNSEFYLLSRKNPIDTVPKLIYHSDLKKAYLSFHITKAIGKPDLENRINSFKDMMSEKLIIWDPITIEERRLLRYVNGYKQPDEQITVETLGNEIKFKIREIESIRKNIDGQIISRDYMLINQSDMIIQHIPETEGEPDISAGCQTELHYAFELPREVYVLWEAEQESSPWIQQHATKIFQGKNMFDELIEHFKLKGYVI
ncbi:MAG: AAA family ATPase [Candidatus Heimdallarchaeaceae archaeon]